jgi:hypothetical protein
MAGQYGARDPRALRRGLAVEPESEEEESSFTAAKGFMIVLVMFVVGAGAAFGYFKLSTPKAPAGVAAPVPTAAPSVSPSVSPNATPKATSTPHALVPASGVQAYMLTRSAAAG